MSYKKKVLAATAWVFVAFALGQLIRLGSNLITTRILEPEMFGIMAIVMTVIFGVEMFSDLGLWSFVVRHKTPNDKHLLNAIWSIQIIRGWFVFSLLLVLVTCLYFFQTNWPSYLSGIYLNKQLPFLIIFVGSTAIINGYKTMASPVMSRDLNYKKLEIAEVISQIVGVAAMLIALWIKPSIWGLALAGVVYNSVNLVFSYYLFDFKHKFVFDKTIAIEVFHYSKWILIASVLTYLFSQGDRLYLASKISAASLGIYSIAFMLSSTLTTILNTIAAKIAFPSMAALAHEENRGILKKRYYKIRLMLDAPIFFGVGVLIALAPYIVDLLYDDRYTSAGWMFQILLISVIGNVLSSIGLECLSALSVTKVRMWVMLIRTIGLFLGMPILFSLYGLEGAIWGISMNVWLSIPVIYLVLNQNQVFSFMNEVRMLPLLGLGFYLTQLLLPILQ